MRGRLQLMQGRMQSVVRMSVQVLMLHVHECRLLAALQQRQSVCMMLSRLLILSDPLHDWPCHHVSCHVHCQGVHTRHLMVMY